MWKSNGCSADTKIRLYESIVLSTRLYGAETWPITVANGRRLKAAHHRWLRRILHVLRGNKISDTTIRERTRQQELGCIIGRRLMWLGHMVRMNKHRRAKQMMNWVPRQFVYGQFVYDTSSTDISSTDILSITVYQLARVQDSYTLNFCFRKSLFSSIPTSTYTMVPVINPTSTDTMIIQHI